MFSRVSVPKSRTADRQRGLSQVETLVAMGLAGIAVAVFVHELGFTVHSRRDLEIVVETQQALHATETLITEDLRRAGRCLPAHGELVAFDGVDSGARDSLTLRIGLVDRSSRLCVQSVLTADAPVGSRRLDVQSTVGFAAGQMVYVTRRAGGAGLFRLASVGENFLLVEGSLDADFASGGGVYAFEERRYSIQEYHRVSALMVSVDDGEAQPLVAGIEELDFRYRREPCPPCAAIDLPSSAGEWRSVREVEMHVVARSTRLRRDGGHMRLAGNTTIEPRKTTCSGCT